MSFLSIYITHPDEHSAKKISEHLVAEKLAACANIFPIQSNYWWQGEFQKDDEWVSLIKTTKEMWEAVNDAVEELHPYDIPCLIRHEVKANEAYENWIRENVKKSD
ncbi:MAG: divalent-cation tolerance protein CutA [Saprospiraceae bacterium]|nr:divalent-cation tolerance protein CutA [Saprospiraceae bacterium]